MEEYYKLKLEMVEAFSEYRRNPTPLTKSNYDSAVTRFNNNCVMQTAKMANDYEFLYLMGVNE